MGMGYNVEDTMNKLSSVVVVGEGMSGQLLTGQLLTGHLLTDSYSPPCQLKTKCPPGTQLHILT